MSKNSSIFKVLTFILILIVIGLLVYVLKNKNTETTTYTTTTVTTTTNTAPPTFASLNDLASQINAKLPVKVDDYTIMQHVEVPNDHEINYHYILTDKFFKESSLNEFNSTFVPKLKSSLCTAPELQYLIKNHINLNYLYHQDEKTVFAQFTVNQTTCTNTQ